LAICKVVPSSRCTYGSSRGEEKQKERRQGKPDCGVYNGKEQGHWGRIAYLGKRFALKTGGPKVGIEATGKKRKKGVGRRKGERAKRGIQIKENRLTLSTT